MCSRSDSESSASSRFSCGWEYQGDAVDCLGITYPPKLTDYEQKILRRFTFDRHPKYKEWNDLRVYQKQTSYRFYGLVDLLKFPYIPLFSSVSVHSMQSTMVTGQKSFCKDEFVRTFVIGTHQSVSWKTVTQENFPTSCIIHEQSSTFECVPCRKNYKFKKDLKNHMLISHNRQENVYSFDGKEKGFKCPVCGKQFTRNDNLKTHLQLFHTLSRVHQTCEICWIIFSKNSNLTRHTRRKHMK